MWFSKTQHVQLHLSDSTWPLTWTGMAKLFRGSRRLTFNHLTGLDITTVTLPWHKRTWIIFKAGTKLLLLHNFSWFGKVLLKLLGLSPEKRLLKRKEIHRKYMLIHGWFEGFPYQMVCTIVNINIKQAKALFWTKMMKDFRLVNFTWHFWRRFKFSENTIYSLLLCTTEFASEVLVKFWKITLWSDNSILDLHWAQYSPEKPLLLTNSFKTMYTHLTKKLTR